MGAVPSFGVKGALGVVAWPTCGKDVAEDMSAALADRKEVLNVELRSSSTAIGTAMIKLLEALTDLGRADANDVIATLKRFAPSSLFVIAPAHVRANHVTPPPLESGTFTVISAAFIRVLPAIPALLCSHKLGHRWAPASAANGAMHLSHKRPFPGLSRP